MPFKVVNPEQSVRLEPSRESFNSPVDRTSLHSFVSSSEHTAFSDHTISLEDNEKLPTYIDDGTHLSDPKSLPLKEKSKISYNHDSGAVKQEPPSTHTIAHSLTTAAQLASALGPDNAPHTTEIDTIPCAGVRIPHGPLTGLLAWRLVVKMPPQSKGKRGWLNDRKNTVNYPVFHTPSQPPQSFHSDHSTIQTPRPSISTVSLPSDKRRSTPLSPDQANTILPRNQTLTRTASTPAVATNFILDTSLPYSIISRDTLIALGYPPSRFPPLSNYPHPQDWEEDSNLNPIIMLSIQNIPTRLRIARPSEASRLGVQFLQDAGVSVFFPRDGEAVGPVLYVESACLLMDVPRTIASLPSGTSAPKTLQQRVRALLGLA